MSFEGEAGGHWYKNTGEPFYTIGDRGVTLRDARKIGAVPSVTTVLQVIDKPALTNWLIEQAVMGALTLPKIDGESDKEWMARIKVDGRAQGKAAAEEGTRIHNACEQVFTLASIAGPVPEEYRLHVDAVQDELIRLFPDVDDWISEKSFAHPLGFGGKVDLHSPSTGIVVDFKSKDGPLDDGKRLAFDQHWQLAAYQVGLMLAEPAHDGMVMPQGAMITSNGRRVSPCANIFVSRTHPGKVASHVWPAEDIADGFAIFKCALALWKQLKNYRSEF